MKKSITSKNCYTTLPTPWPDPRLGAMEMSAGLATQPGKHVKKQILIQLGGGRGLEIRLNERPSDSYRTLETTA